MAIEGPLRELGIHDVFQLLDLSRKTGVLRIASELRHNAGTIYFEAGAIIFAEIRSNPYPLGVARLRAGKIAELDLLPAEWETLALVDGRRDVRTIAAELVRSDFEVAKTLFGLDSAGVIILADAGTDRRERATLHGDLAELVARAEDALGRRDFE